MEPWVEGQGAAATGPWVDDTPPSDFSVPLAAGSRFSYLNKLLPW